MTQFQFSLKWALLIIAFVCAISAGVGGILRRPTQLPTNALTIRKFGDDFFDDFYFGPGDRIEYALFHSKNSTKEIYVDMMPYGSLDYCIIQTPNNAIYTDRDHLVRRGDYAGKLTPAMHQRFLTITEAFPATRIEVAKIRTLSFKYLKHSKKDGDTFADFCYQICFRKNSICVLNAKTKEELSAF